MEAFRHKCRGQEQKGGHALLTFLQESRQVVRSDSGLWLLWSDPPEDHPKARDGVKAREREQPVKKEVSGRGMPSSSNAQLPKIHLDRFRTLDQKMDMKLDLVSDNNNVRLPKIIPALRNMPPSIGLKKMVL